MNTTYFVTYKLFNGDSSGWAYKIELKTEDHDVALRKYHELLSTYIGKAPYTFVSVAMTDQRDNILESEYWPKSVQVEPEVQPEE